MKIIRKATAANSRGWIVPSGRKPKNPLPLLVKSLLPKIINRRDTEILRWLAYTTIGLIGPAVLTVPGNKATNYALQNILHIAPKPVREVEDKSIIDGERYNGFLANHKDFRTVIDVIKKLGLSSIYLDSNGDGINLNSNEEVQALIEYIKSQKNNKVTLIPKEELDKALEILTTLHTLDKYIFGTNGIDPEVFRQGTGMGSCENQAVEKGLAFTPNGQNILRQIIEIREVDPTTGSISGVRHIHGKEIPFIFKDLEEWMSVANDTLPHSNDGSLGLSLIEQGLQEAGRPYDSIPFWLPSTPAILATNENFVTLFVPSLDDDQLKNILLNAPEELVTAGTYIENKFKAPFLLGAMIAYKSFPEMFQKEFVRSEIQAEAFRNTAKQIKTLTLIQ